MDGEDRFAGCFVSPDAGDDAGPLKSSRRWLSVTEL
jgi:hypothetical protein